MTVPAVQNALIALLAIYPERYRHEIEEGIPHLVRMAERLGLEVLQAEADRVSFADAVRRPRDFPLMGRVHFGVLDLFQFEVTADLVEAFRKMCKRGRLFESGNLGRYLLAAAAVDDKGKDRASLRFLIYECVRATAWALTYDSAQPEALGCFRDLDDIAEKNLRARLRAVAMYDESVRPLKVLVAEAVEYLFNESHERLSRLRELWSEGEVILDELDTVLAQAKAARVMSAPRAAILRNRYAREVGDETVVMIELADRQPLTFPSHDAAKQASKRLKDAILLGRELRPRRPRLIDLLRDEMAVVS